MDPEILYADAADVLGSVGRYTAVVSDNAWARLADHVPRPTQLISALSLEELVLDQLVGLAHDQVDTVVGVGGGVALDTAKYLALRTGRPLVLVPSTLGSLAPFTNESARRVRRQVVFAGEIAGRVVVDLARIAEAPAERNRAGAAAIAATAPATWDWRLADSRGHGLPFATRIADTGTGLRAALAEAAEDIAAGSAAGLEALAGLLTQLGAALTSAGSRLLVDGATATFVQAYEHRLAGLPRPGGDGGLLGLGAVAMAALQDWYGVSAGGEAKPDEVISLLTRCGVVANPHQLGLDEGTFRGLLRHAVRFHVGEFLPWTVLNEADVNGMAAEELWRQVWRVPRVALD